MYGLESQITKNQTKESRIVKFNRISREYDEIFHSVASLFEMTDTTFWILYALRDTTEMLTQTQLCSRLCLPKQTVNSALKKLQADGYLYLLSEEKNRVKPIWLTEKGVHLAQDTVDKMRQMEAETLEELSEEELDVYFHVFRKYLDSLQEKIKHTYRGGNL